MAANNSQHWICLSPGGGHLAKVKFTCPVAMPTMSTRSQEEVKEGEVCCFPCWNTLSDDILLHIFSSLEAESLYHVGLVCKPWLRVAFDEFLWKDLFYHHWKISRSIPMAPGKYSWVQEYKRLLCHTPAVESETLKPHVDEVLHVSYAHNGTMFATCSKDGFIRVWDTTYPTSLKHEKNMDKCADLYTPISQFNESDTLLLVSGVHVGFEFDMIPSVRGIAVFSLTDGQFLIQHYFPQSGWDYQQSCLITRLVPQKPMLFMGHDFNNVARQLTPDEGELLVNSMYDVSGTWYNDLFLLSGNLDCNDCSVLRLNKAYQETTSEDESVCRRLFKFSNVNGGVVRTMLISNCLTSDESEVCAGNAENASSAAIGREVANEKENNSNLKRSQNMEADGAKMKPQKPQGVRSDENVCFCTKLKTADNCDVSDRLYTETRDKYLIFTKGEKTYVPHQIAIKRIKHLKEFSPDGRRLLPNVSENLQGLDRPEDEYDTADHLIDMHGRIIGMSLAPDHRYLYVNSRPWPQNYEIQDPFYPPPIAQEIDIHVIDLMNMREDGTMHHSHKTYTPNDERFFIFLDVCDEYVASCSSAEDKHGYLWDRHYGLRLHKYPHTGVVNSFAFNPVDPEVLVTVSDDGSIKVWRSRARQREVTSKYQECV